MKVLAAFCVSCLAAAGLAAEPNVKTLSAEQRQAGHKINTGAQVSAGGAVFSTLLTSGVAAPFSLAAVSSPTVVSNDFGFRIVVPTGATRLEVRLTGMPAGALFAIGLRYNVDFTPGQFNADNGGIGNENPVVVTPSSNPALRAGTYYIAVLVLTSPTAINGTITATVETSSAPPPPAPGSGVLLTSGSPTAFELRAVSQATLFAGDFSFRIVVPAGATQLEVRMVTSTPGVDVDLYVRYGTDVTLSSGRPVADYRSESLTGTETITVTPSSSPPLREGTYFIAFGVFTTGIRPTGTITATVTAGSPPPPAPVPAIAVSATSLTFGAQTGSNPASQTFTVRNSGGGTLDFQITSTVTWLSATPNRGTSTGQTVSITAAINTAGMAAGTFNGELRVTSGTLTPGVIAVRLTLTAPAPPPPTVAIVSAASFAAGASVAAESIASAFGSGLAAFTEVATTVPLPTSLAGARVRVTDSAGAERFADLFFVSAGQINFLIPRGTAAGRAAITVLTAAGATIAGTVQVDPVAPSLFTANASGRGVPAALALRVRGDGAQSTEPVFACGASPGSCVPTALDLGPDSDQVFLLLFGTGIRGFSRASAVTATIGGETAEVLGAAPQGQFVGLDQVNARLSRRLIARGEVNVVLTVDGRAANTVTINVGGSLPQPRISSLSPTNGIRGQTISTFTISGENLSSVNAIEFSPATGITVSNVRATSASVTAQLVISSTATIGARMVGVVAGALRSNQLPFEVMAAPPPTPVPSITTVNRRTGRAGETIPDFTVTGTNMGTVTGLEFSAPTGITVSDLRVTATTVTATVAIDASAAVGTRNFRLVSTAGTPSPSSYIFGILAAGPPGTFTISNLRVGTVTTATNRTTIPITVDFEDPSGSATSGSLRTNFNIASTAIHGFSSSSASGVTPGQTSGTMQIELQLFSIRLVSGLRTTLDITLTNAAGVESNPLITNFQVP